MPHDDDLPEGNDGPENLSEPPAFFPYDEHEEPAPKGEGVLVEVNVEGVYQRDSATDTQRFVILSEGERRLTISIGPFEAHCIHMALDNQLPDRPMPHDLIKTIIDRLGGKLKAVEIDDLWNGVFYAKLILEGDEEMSIDARPSDAVAIAIRCDAPIFVSDTILDSESVE